MLLKRKAYLIAIGVVLSHLTIADYIGSGTVKNFGDCPTCGGKTAQSVPFEDSHIPMDKLVETLNKGLANGGATGYVAGNTINSALLPSSPKYADYTKNLKASPATLGFATDLRTLAAESLVRNPLMVENGLPIVPPQFNVPTQERIDSLFPANWGTCIPASYIYPYTPAYSMPLAWMI